MEKVYPRVERTDTAEIFAAERGRGRVVYFPWDIDRTFWEVLGTDHAKLLANAVVWATNEEPPVSVTGPGILDVTIWRQKNSMTVHLVNLTNPMMLKGPFRELLPVGEQKIRVRVPDGVKVASAKFLAAGVAPKMVQEEALLTVSVPSVLDHEVLAIDLEQ